jgi:hypothetical protein
LKLSISKLGIIFDDRFELRLDRFLTVVVSVDVGWTPTQNADVHVVLVDGFDELTDRYKSDHFVSISDLELLAQFADTELQKLSENLYPEVKVETDVVGKDGVSVTSHCWSIE